jgi:crotonobetainyl-CoA:carnitine CoA-transferase CaiB-like acyl-CoA transferase
MGTTATSASSPFPRSSTARRRDRSAEFGEHTEQVLLDLGFDWDAITKLKDAGVIIDGGRRSSTWWACPRAPG